MTPESPPEPSLPTDVEDINADEMLERLETMQEKHDNLTETIADLKESRQAALEAPDQHTDYLDEQIAYKELDAAEIQERIDGIVALLQKFTQFKSQLAELERNVSELEARLEADEMEQQR